VGSDYRKAKTGREKEHALEGYDKEASHAKRALGREISIPSLRLVRNA